jgi:hypothetical protein
MAKVVVDFGPCESWAPASLLSLVQNIEYYFVLEAMAKVVLDFGLCKSCVV